MRSFFSALYSLVISLWVGGLVAIGYLAAPVLFTQLADKTVAGNLAGHLFAAMAWVSFASGTYLLLYLLFRRGIRALGCSVFWLVLCMLLIAAAGHFGVTPVIAQIKLDALPRQVMESALRDRFSTWHGISSVMYLLNTLLGAWLVLWQGRGK